MAEHFFRSDDDLAVDLPNRADRQDEQDKREELLKKSLVDFVSGGKGLIGVHSATVMVPRSGISTSRSNSAGSRAGRQVARVRRVLAICRAAISVVGGG